MVFFEKSCMADFNEMKQKIEACLRFYDGNVTPYEDMEETFDGLFHEDFNHTMAEGKTICKAQVRDTAKFLLSMGTSADLILFKRLSGVTFEVELRFSNALADIQNHLTGTIADGKLIKIEQYEDARRLHTNLKTMDELYRTKKNLEYLIQLQNDKDTPASDLQDALDNLLFDDSLVSAIVQTQLYKRGMRTIGSTPDEFLASKFVLGKFERMDAQHVEVKVLRICVIEDCKSIREEWHDVFTVRDGRILAIDPCVDFKKGLTNKGKPGKRERKVILQIGNE